MRLPNSIKEIKKYIRSLGYELEIWKEFGDLVGATIWVKNRYIPIALNESGKYSVAMQGSERKAYLCAAQKAYWFAKKHLKKVKPPGKGGKKK